MMHPHFTTGQPCDCGFTKHLEGPSDGLGGDLRPFGPDPGASPGLGNSGLHNAKTAMIPQAFQPMYHVSPRTNRESILQHGLQGQDPSRAKQVWDHNWEQPKGNYMFPDYESAGDYVQTLHHREQGNGYADEDDRYEYPQPPEGFDDWDYDKQDDWHVKNEPQALNEDPHGYDIWQVHPHGMPLAYDPETPLATPEQWDLGRIHDVYQEEAEGYQNPEDARWLHQDVGNNYGQEPARFYTPQAVSPNRLTLHDHIPRWDMGDDYEPEGAEFPSVWNYIPKTEIPFPGHE